MKPRMIRPKALAALGAAVLFAGEAAAQEVCSSMQVLLSIAPKHREHVMK